MNELEPEDPLGVEWRALPFNLAGLLTNPVLESKKGTPALNQRMTKKIFDAINATQTPAASYEHKVRGEMYRSEQEEIYGETNPDLPSWAVKKTKASNAIKEEAMKRIEARNAQAAEEKAAKIAEKKAAKAAASN